MYTENKIEEEFLSNPEKFIDSGKSYELLNYFLKSHDLRILDQMINTEKEIILHETLYFLTELGSDECFKRISQIENILDIYNNTSLTFFGLECVFLASNFKNHSSLIRLVYSLKSDELSIKSQGVRLLSLLDLNRLTFLKKTLPKVSEFERKWIELLDLIIENSERNIEKMLISNDEDEFFCAFIMLLKLAENKKYLSIARNSSHPDSTFFINMIKSLT